MITYNTLRKIAQQPMKPNASVNNDDKNGYVNPIWLAHNNWRNFNSLYRQLDDGNDQLKKFRIFRLRNGKDQVNLQRQLDTALRQMLKYRKAVSKTQADLNNHVDNTFGGSITKPDPNSGYYTGVRDYMNYLKKLKVPSHQKNRILYGTGTKYDPQGGLYGLLSQKNVHPLNVRFLLLDGFGRLTDGEHDLFAYSGGNPKEVLQKINKWLVDNGKPAMAFK